MSNNLKTQNILKFQHITLLGIDFGQKVIGTSRFTPGRDPFVLMHEKIVVQSEQQVLKALKAIVDTEAIEIIVIGIPYFTDGKESEQTVKIKAFAEKLRQEFSALQVFEQDETLTTKEAEDRMKNSPQFHFKVDPTQIDCLSAVIILEDFLKSH